MGMTFANAASLWDMYQQKNSVDAFTSDTLDFQNKQHATFINH